MRPRIWSWALVLVALLFIAAPAAQACNSVCVDQGNGCSDCEFSLFCNRCWCVYEPMCQCETFICAASTLPDDDPLVEEGASLATLLQGAAACTQGLETVDKAARFDSGRRTDETMIVRELLPRT